MKPTTRLVERRPLRRSHWLELAGPPMGNCPTSYWQRSGVVVVSTLEDAQLPAQPERTGLQWHASVSFKQRRPDAAHVARALRDFAMLGAEEDNHEPGIARHFWLVVHAADRRDCDCKESEAVIVETDGYAWTNPHDASECRGCQYEAVFGRRCELHPSSEDARTPRRLGL